MNSQRKNRQLAAMRLQRLERRLAPAAMTEIVSRVAPTMSSDATGAYEVREQFGNALNYSPRLASADGRYHVFTSFASNLVSGVVDGNGVTDVFLFDRLLDSTVLVSHKAGQPQTAANGYSYEPAMSADGRYVVFSSSATDAIVGFQYDKSALGQIYLWDRVTGNSSLVSTKAGVQAIASNGGCQSPIISDDGQVIAYQSDATNLVPNFDLENADSGVKNAYCYRMATGTNALLDREPGSINTPGRADAQPIDISSNGEIITVISGARNLSLQFPPLVGKWNVYVYRVSTGTMTPVSFSANSASAAANGHSRMPLVNSAGTTVVFQTNATDMGFGGPTGVYNIIRYDIATGTRALVSNSAGLPGTGGNGSSFVTAISADGRYSVFQSNATDLVAGQIDSNGANADVFVHDAVTNQITLVSRKAGTAATTGNLGIATNASVAANISDDGSIITFTSPATDLVPGFVDGNNGNVKFDLPYDLFAFRLATGTVSLISGRLGSPTQGVDRGTHRFDGNGAAGVILWSSLASNVVNVRDTNVQTDVFLTDLQAGTTILVSKVNGPPTGAAGTIQAFGTGATTTPDGRFVAFVSEGINIVPGQVDKPYTYDVFLLDRETGQTILVSHDCDNPLSSDLTQTRDGGSGQPVISDDGRYVAYASQANRIVQGFIDGNGSGSSDDQFADLYLFDRITGLNTLISHRWDNSLRGGNYNTGRYTVQSSAVPAISADGRYVAFQSQAGDLVQDFVEGAPAAVYPTQNLYLWDRVSGNIRLISGQVGLTATGGTYASGQPSMSVDGRYVAFWSGSRNLLPGMTTSAIDIFVFDRITGQNSLVSHLPGSTTNGGNGGSDFPQMSRDGNFVVFASAASNLVAGASDTNNTGDIFIYERGTGNITLVSHAHNSSSAAASRWSGFREYNNLDLMSDDGRFITYLSGADNLVPGFVDQNGVFSGPLWGDAYLYDRLTNTNRLISRAAGTMSNGANGEVEQTVLSGDGRFVVFVSSATNHVNGLKAYRYQSTSDTVGFNGYNLYVYDRLRDFTAFGSPVAGDPLQVGSGFVDTAAVNYNGSLIAFLSSAGAMVNNDSNDRLDIFARVTPPPTITSMKVADGSGQRSVVRSLTVMFDQPVLFAGDPAGAFVVRRGGETVAVSAAVANGTATTVTLTFGGPGTQFGSLVDGRYSLTVLSSQVQGIEALDGDADGLAGGDYVANFHRLFGDSNGDARVDAVDFLAFRLGLGMNNPAFDYDGDGLVAAADFLQFRLRFLQVV